MATYAVFEPPLKEQSAGIADALAHAERFKFVRDGFSWLAFLFTPFWMLFNRLWLAFVCYIVLIAVIAVGATVIGIAAGAVTLALLVLALLVGFEAATLRRRKLLRKRWQDLGVVVADNRETAERRFFDRWTAQTRAPAVASAPAPAEASAQPAQRAPAYDSDSYVIGMFPPPKGSGGSP